MGSVIQGILEALVHEGDKNLLSKILADVPDVYERWNQDLFDQLIYPHYPLNAQIVVPLVKETIIEELLPQSQDVVVDVAVLHHLLPGAAVPAVCVTKINFRLTLIRTACPLSLLRLCTKSKGFLPILRK